MNGERIHGGMTIDLLVDPNCRRQGFFKKLGKAAIEDLPKVGMDFQLAFPRRPYVHSGFIDRLNWLKIGDLPLLIKPVDLINILERKTGNNRLGRIMTRNMRSLRRGLSKIFSRKRGLKFTFKSIDHLPEKINELSQIFTTQFPISIVRDKSYLEWRYFQKPNGNYKIFGIFDDDDLLGIIVLKIKKISSFEVGFIVDILSTLDKEVIDSLIKGALNFFYEEKVNFGVSILTKNNIYYRFLRKNGFFCVPRKINPKSYILDAYISSPKIDKSLFSDLNNWFITIGDWDIL